MSESSSDKPRHPLGKLKSRLKRREVKREYTWRMLLLLPLWVLVAFATSNLVVAFGLIALEWFGVSADTVLRPAVLQTTIAVLVYALALAIVIVGPYVVNRRITTNLSTLGLNRLISWTDIGLSPVVFIVYMLTTTLAIAAIVALIPAFPINEAQDVGFKALGTRTDSILAFITLVVLAPIAEETLFRGYLYGKLKAYVPVFWAAIVTSFVFALAHFQLNVGVDVFILSLFLCWLRSLTGSIWAGILVHMIKNALAYYLLFVQPLIGV